MSRNKKMSSTSVYWTINHREKTYTMYSTESVVTLWLKWRWDLSEWRSDRYLALCLCHINLPIVKVNSFKKKPNVLKQIANDLWQEIKQDKKIRHSLREKKCIWTEKWKEKKEMDLKQIISFLQLCKNLEK